MAKNPEVDKEIFFKGWPEPARGYTCSCSPDGDFGPIDVTVTMADGRHFSATFSGVYRTPHSSDVMQVDYDNFQQWPDGTPMTGVEKRQVALIIVSSYESQLYASEEAQREIPS